jgi:adenylate cyclase
LSAWRKARAAVLLSLIPGLLGLAFVRWPVTAGLETSGLDLLFQLRGRQPSPTGVCVVAIDDASYLEMELDLLQPWPRALHGELVRILKREGARSVAFDVLFEGPGDPAQDVQFELALFDAGNVVLGSTVELIDDPRFRQARLVEPHEPFAESAAMVAEVELPPGRDGVIREAWLVPEDRPGLALGAYEVATGDESYRTERGTRLIDYYGPARTIQTVSLYQALDPERFLPPDFFRDKIVFIGASQVAAVAVTDVKDSFKTPFSGGEVGNTYGVEIHATIAANLLEGRRIEILPERIETVLLFVLALFASLLFIYLRPLAGVAALIALELAAWFAGYVAFTQPALWIPIVIPSAVQLPSAYVVSLIWYYMTTVREREKIRRAFSFYLSPEMIRAISESPEALNLGGEQVVGTAVFSDIKGFTSIAEKMTAEETASMLNEYFSEITRGIFDTGGTLIKYIGDAVFAIWGAPVRMQDHATQACRAAIAMARVQDSLGDRPAARLVTRIGVHTGPMLVGNLGSSQRFDYTAIGDTINLAARLESLNKSVGTLALASGETLAETDGELIVRSLGRVRVVGRAEPVVLFELLGLPGDATRPDAEAIERFERAVADFSARRLREAAEGFREVRERCGGEDGPSELYLRTIAQLEAEPAPGDWDGVINFATK